MLELARSPAPADRDRLLLALADLCEGGGCETPQAQALVRDVFMGLVDRVEHDIRLRLAWKLAHASWAPHELVVLLAHSEVEIARPVIAANPVLGDRDLIHLLVDASLDHQVEVARRPQLGAAVVTAILDQASPEVLTALAGNASAQVSPLGMDRLVGLSQTVVSLRAPLTHHPALTLDLGAVLYAWVGETLRQALGERFAVEGPAFEAAVSAAVSEARGAPGDGASLETDERAGMDRRVVAKLKSGGQLRPGLLMRALRDGKLTLFTIALAELGEFTTDQVRQAMDEDSAESLALACAAVGVDRSALASLIGRVRALNQDRPGRQGEVASLNGAATLLDRDGAGRAFRKRVAVPIEPGI